VRDIAMTPDGSEIYWCAAGTGYVWSTILMSRLVDGRWSKPEVTPWGREIGSFTIEPHISPDGQHFYFLSNRPDPETGEEAGDQDIWVMDRVGEGWSEPYNLGAPINTEHAEFFASVTRDGTMYFTRQPVGERANFIYRSRMVDGEWQEPVRLPEQVNCGVSQYNAFIDPDEEYLIVCVDGRDDTVGACDYYIVFRNGDDTWSEPVNMGEKVNTAHFQEFSPYVSPDGKYFFFMSTRTPDQAGKELSWDEIIAAHSGPQNGNPDIYWMEAAFIDALRPYR
ncbi:hypothetical protein ACFL6R_07400, partial [Gemmatimonadota bacterium]